MSLSRSSVIGLSAIVVAVTLVATGSHSPAPAAPSANRTLAEAAETVTTWFSTLRGSRLVAVLRQSSLDLRHVDAAPGEQVVVNVFVTLGRAQVRVPQGWAVNTSAVPLLGSIDQDRIESVRDPGALPVAAPPRLILRGFVFFGRVKVTS